jgi:LmbE family N-acetylglucosaminyl deacetylase
MNNVLAIGSHPDDLELGCGGTLIQHLNDGDAVTLLIVTDGENGPGLVSERRKEQQKSCETMGVDIGNVVWGSLPDLAVGNHEREVVSLIERVIDAFHIDLIYTHGIHDTHQDHRAVALGTLGAARKCRRILFYDSPSSYDFHPTMFVDIAATLEKKIAALLCHASQVAASEKVSPEHVRGEALHRGRQSLTMAAEGFAPHRYLMR